MKVISWNALHGMAIPPIQNDGLDEALLRLEIAAKKLDVDVLGLQEIDFTQERSFNIHHVQEVALALETQHWAFAATVIGTPGGKWRALNDGEPRIISQGQGTLTEMAYGIGLISRVPVTKWHRIDLGKSPVGLPLPVPSKRGFGLAYVKDEPRTALVAELENGFTVAVTHLSFVPFVNFFQLRTLQRRLKSIPGTPLILGDLNLPWNLPQSGGWKSLITKLTYPSWGAKIQFDYVLARDIDVRRLEIFPLEMDELGVSDHLPIGVKVTRAQSPKLNS